MRLKALVIGTPFGTRWFASKAVLHGHSLNLAMFPLSGICGDNAESGCICCSHRCNVSHELEPLVISTAHRHRNSSEAVALVIWLLRRHGGGHACEQVMRSRARGMSAEVVLRRAIGRGPSVVLYTKKDAFELRSQGLGALACARFLSMCVWAPSDFRTGKVRQTVSSTFVRFFQRSPRTRRLTVRQAVS